MLALACLCWSSPNMQGYVLFSSVTSNDFLYLTTQSTGCHFYWPRFRIQRINADLILLWCIMPSLQIIYSIKLPGKVILGEGKPENQNHAIIFTRGDAIQTIDMNQVSGGAFLQLLACPEVSVNVFAQVMLLQLFIWCSLLGEKFPTILDMGAASQDHFLEEALKVRNLLEEFDCKHGLRRPTILGVREHVFTGRLERILQTHSELCNRYLQLFLNLALVYELTTHMSNMLILVFIF